MVQKRVFRGIAAVGIAFIAVCAFGQCSSNGNCTPGDTRVCTGPAACSGGQSCGSDGQWSTCDCGGNDASIQDSSKADSPADSPGDTTTDAGDGSTCSVTDTTDTCAHICAAIYDCGLVTCGTGSQLCPAFDGSTSQRNDFFNGDGASGCVAQCGPQINQFKALVDPNNCQTTISTVKSFNSQFTTFCQ
jgi:hypothetical protein